MARSTSAPWTWKCQRAAASREEESWSTRRTWNTWNRYGDASAAAQLLSDDTDQDVQFGSSVCIWFVCFLFVCLFISWQMEDSEGTVRQIGAFSDGINNLTVRHWAAPVQSDRSEWLQQSKVNKHESSSEFVLCPSVCFRACWRKTSFTTRCQSALRRSTQQQQKTPVFETLCEKNHKHVSLHLPPTSEVEHFKPFPVISSSRSSAVAFMIFYIYWSRPKYDAWRFYCIYFIIQVCVFLFSVIREVRERVSLPPLSAVLQV